MHSSLHENQSQSYGASPAICDHTVSPATRHRWTRPTLTPAMQAGTRFTYPGGMEGWVDLGVGYIPRWFTCPQTVTHPGTGSHHLIGTQPSQSLYDLLITSPTSWRLHNHTDNMNSKLCICALNWMGTKVHVIISLIVLPWPSSLYQSICVLSCSRLSCLHSSTDHLQMLFQLMTSSYLSK